MIHQVSADNLYGYGRQLDQMFAVRLSVAPPASDARDDELAIYLMDIDDRGDLAGALRLHPGSDLEPGWRADRWLTDSDSSLARLVVGLFAFCGALVPSGMRITADAALARRLLALGCRLAPLGQDEWEMNASPSDMETVRSHAGMGELDLPDRSRDRIAARR